MITALPVGLDELGNPPVARSIAARIWGEETVGIDQTIGSVDECGYPPIARSMTRRIWGEVTVGIDWRRECEFGGVNHTLEKSHGNGRERGRNY